MNGGPGAPGWRRWDRSQLGSAGGAVGSYPTRAPRGGAVGSSRWRGGGIDQSWQNSRPRAVCPPWREANRIGIRMAADSWTIYPP